MRGDRLPGLAGPLGRGVAPAAALAFSVDQRLDVPVYNLLGGRYRDRVRVYANGWSYGMKEPDDYARAAEKVVKQGFTALKFDPVTPYTAFDPRQPSLELQVREEIEDERLESRLDLSRLDAGSIKPGQQVALMQANDVKVVKADAKFVADVKAKTSALEAKWVKEAEAKGLKNAARVLADFRAEIARVSPLASASW